MTKRTSHPLSIVQTSTKAWYGECSPMQILISRAELEYLVSAPMTSPLLLPTVGTPQEGHDTTQALHQNQDTTRKGLKQAQYERATSRGGAWR